MKTIQRVFGMLLCTTLFATATAQTVQVTDMGNESFPLEMRQTSWETIDSNANFVAHMQLIDIGGSTTLSIRLALAGHNKPFYVDKDHNVTIELADENVLTLKTTELTKSCKGCASLSSTNKLEEGIWVIYDITYEDLMLLASAPMLVLNIATDKGYLAMEPTVSASTKLQRIAKLVSDY